MDHGNLRRGEINAQDQALRPDAQHDVLEPGTGTAAQVQYPVPPPKKPIFLVYGLQLVNRSGYKTLGPSLPPV